MAKKKKAGRPKMAPGAKMDSVLMVRMKTRDYRRLIRQARRAGVPTSTFVRDLILREIE